MSEKVQHDIPSWLQKANHDLITADRVISIEPIILDIACFRCQQVIEKFLKAYLIFQGQNVGRTHNLIFLLPECVKYNSKLDEVKTYYSMAVEVKKLVENLISI